ncbi:MAG: cytochrome c3 family protein [Desulfobacterales bacterium]|nr:cytochrome c3 family protein [Desulfobacterales bacterium]
MLKNILFVLVMMNIILAPGAPWAIAGDELDAIHLPVGALTIAAPRGVEPRRSPVAFPHSLHFDHACKTCHHKWNGYTPVSGCSASGCHDLTGPQKNDKSKRASSAGEARYFKKAYHKLCLACHRRLKRQRKEMERSRTAATKPAPKTGPTGCVQCHPGS